MHESSHCCAAAEWAWLKIGVSEALHGQVLCGFLLLVFIASMIPSCHCVALHAACLEASRWCAVVCSGHVARCVF